MGRAARTGEHGKLMQRGSSALSSKKFDPSVMDLMIEGCCYIDEEEADPDTLPVVNLSKLQNMLKTAPDTYRPSTNAIWACCRNDFTGKALKLLLQQGGGIFRCNDWHSVNLSTPISICCSRGNIKGLETMMEVADEAGFRLDAGKTESRGSEPLNWAVQSRGNIHAMGSIRDYCKIIKLLVTKLGRDIECISVNNTSQPTTGTYERQASESQSLFTCVFSTQLIFLFLSLGRSGAFL